MSKENKEVSTRERLLVISIEFWINGKTQHRTKPYEAC
jgi:hypothetical protein